MADVSSPHSEEVSDEVSQPEPSRAPGGKGAGLRSLLKLGAIGLGLGLGAAAAVVAGKAARRRGLLPAAPEPKGLLRGAPSPPPEDSSPEERSPEESSPPASGSDSDGASARPLGELPADAAVSWIPGPSGGLRIVDRNRKGKLPVIYVHGLGGRAEFWSDALRALGPGLRGIALDLPGHGESDDGSCEIEDMSAAIGAVADGLGLRRFLIVAHSLGASAALAYAARRPARVAGLFLVDPTGDQSRQPARQRESMLETVAKDPHREMAWNFGQLLAGSAPEVEKLVIDALEGASEEAILGGFSSGLDFAAGEVLAEYLGADSAGPVFSVISDLNDLPYSLHRLRADVEMRPIFGAGHWLMLDRPEAILEAFWEFLEQAS